MLDWYANKNEAVAIYSFWAMTQTKVQYEGDSFKVESQNINISIQYTVTM